MTETDLRPRRAAGTSVAFLLVALLVEAAAAVVAIWPIWVHDHGVTVKCGTPAFAARLDYADDLCRIAGKRRLAAGGDLALVGCLVVPLSRAVYLRDSTER